MIDLRSDTITLPDKDMLDTIFNAKLGDSSRIDNNGRGEDKTVSKLEDLAAKITGKERSLFFPTGTLANTSSILSYCLPGDNVLIDNKQHIYLSEKIVFSNRIGQLNPVFYKLDSMGKPDLNDLREKIKSNNIKLLCIENTHNFAGGICLNLDDLIKISELAKEFKIPIHLDGARLFNAAASLNCEAYEICKHVDSVMFCLSKGLGAPIGSLLCGNHKFINTVLITKKLLGGNMRQAGVIAAPGIYALKNNISKVKEDNSKAQYVNSLLQDLKKIKAPKSVDSNIIMLDISKTDLSGEEICEQAKNMGLLIRTVLDNKVRLVFHNGVDMLQAETAAKIIKSIDLLL